MATPTELLRRGEIFVRFNPGKRGVSIPNDLRDQKECVLSFSYDLPAMDVAITDNSISATLEFRGRKVWCEIPWNAVIEVGGRGPWGRPQIWRPRPVLTLIKGGLDESNKEVE